MSKRDEKLHLLRLAIRRVETGRGHRVKKGAKLNVVTVATEAEVSPSTIHTRYPEIVDEIRQKTGKEARVQRDEKHKELKACQSRNRVLLAEIVDLKAALSSVTSRFATATIRVKQLEAGTNVTPIGR